MKARKLLIIAIALLLTAAMAQAQTYAPTGTSTLSVAVGAEASIMISTATTTLTSAATPFASYLGTTNFAYKIRTSGTSGVGTITLKLGGALMGTGSNTIALSNLSYICSTVAPASGSNCASAVTASSTTATKVADFGADNHSADAGTTGNSVSWTLVNNPTYVVDTYTALATFTISAT